MKISRMTRNTSPLIPLVCARRDTIVNQPKLPIIVDVDHAQEFFYQISLSARWFITVRRAIYHSRLIRRTVRRGLINSKPCPENPKLRTPLPIEEKILYPRRNYHFGQVRISGYLARYHDIKISGVGI